MTQPAADREQSAAAQRGAEHDATEGEGEADPVEFGEVTGPQDRDVPRDGEGDAEFLTAYDQEQPRQLVMADELLDPVAESQQPLRRLQPVRDEPVERDHHAA